MLMAGIESGDQKEMYRNFYRNFTAIFRNFPQFYHNFSCLGDRNTPAPPPQCFAMEGSHRRLKRNLCNGRGLSLLQGGGGAVVVDNYTIDNSLAAHWWDVTKRAQHGQGPISGQRYVGRTRRRPPTNMQHLQTLERWFPCRWRKT